MLTAVTAIRLAAVWSRKQEARERKEGEKAAAAASGDVAGGSNHRARGAKVREEGSNRWQAQGKWDLCKCRDARSDCCSCSWQASSLPAAAGSRRGQGGKGRR